MEGVPLTPAYVAFLYSRRGTLNLSEVFNHDQQEVLFLGAKFSFEAGKGWVGMYDFAEGFNRENVIVGGITIPLVTAFDYVWATYIRKKTATDLFEAPSAVYCDRLYLLADHRDLFTGGA